MAIIKATNKFINLDSFVHKLDPRTKLLSFLALTIVIFLPIGLYGSLFGLCSAILCMFFAKMHFLNIWKTFKITLFLIVFILIINLLTITPVNDALLYTLMYFFKLWGLLVYGSILTFTTSQQGIAYGISWLLYPLKYLGVKVEDVSLMITLALRYVPVLLTDVSNILLVEASRGLDFKDWNLKTKFIAFKTMLLPLFVSSFKRADDISNALIAKGYKLGVKKTRYITYKFTWYDFWAIIGISTIIAGMILFMQYLA